MFSRHGFSKAITIALVSVFFLITIVTTKLASASESIIDLYNAGMKAFEQGDFATAIRYLEQGIERSKKEKPQVVTMLSSLLGVAYSEDGQYEKALLIHKRALEIKRKTNNLAGEWFDLTQLGTIHIKLSQYDQAILYYEQSLRIARRSGDKENEAASLCNMGLVCTNLAQYEKSNLYLKQALSISRKIKNKKCEAHTLGNLGALHTEIGESNNAISYYEQALALHKRLNDVRGEAGILANLASTYSDLDQYEKALTFNKQALELYRKIKDVPGEGLVLNNMGGDYEKLGQDEQAIACFEQAGKISRMINDAQGEANVLINLGKRYHAQGKYEKAISFIEQAIEINRKVKDKKTEALSLNNLGAIFSDLCQPEKEVAYYEQALEIYRQISNKPGEAGALSNLGSVYLSLGQYQKAISYSEQALEIFRKIERIRGVTVNLNNLAKAYYDLGKRKEAITYYEKALENYRKINNKRGEALVLSNLGMILSEFGQYEDAIHFHLQAEKIYSEIDFREAHADNLINLGVAFKAKKEYVKAEKYLNEAVKIYEGVRGSLKSEEKRTSYIKNNMSNAYPLLASIYCQANEPEKAYFIVERSRSRAFLDILGTKELSFRKREDLSTKNKLDAIESKINELQSEQSNLVMTPSGRKTRAVTAIKTLSRENERRLELIAQLKESNPELSDILSVSPLRPSEIKRLLDDQTGLLEYYHCGDWDNTNRLLVFFVSRESIKLKTVSVEQKTLDDKVNHLKELISTQAKDSSIHQLTSELYKLLIGTFSNDLKNFQNIVIIPHGSLHHLPFAALYDGKEYLGDDYNITTLLSGSVLKYVLQKRRSNRGSILALGNPKTNLAYLKEAKREVGSVSKLFKKKRIYTGKKARESVLKGKLDGWDVIHLACHGLFNSDHPELSYLALTPDKQYDGRLEMHELFGLDLTGTSLVTLSACSSAKGKVSSGDDIVGFSRGLIFAGTPSILATLWEVDDESTREFMESFYKHYTRGLSKAESLRKARVETRKKYPHPYHWASFVLIGDWQ